MANASDLSKVAKQYGIETAQDLATEKAIMIGRQAMGGRCYYDDASSINLTCLHGNGPLDRARRQTWRDNGIRPKEVKIGNAWVS